MKPSIKKMMVVTAGLMAMAGMASATLLTETGGLTSTDIPDGNPVGIANNVNVTDDPANAAIQDVSVNLDISGGYNGDLYGYLVFQPTGGGSATMEMLLNQVGTGVGNPFGDPGSGFNVTLNGSGTADIHGVAGTAGLQTTGNYTPDSVNTLDGTFANGQGANGQWTLFLADLSTGGGTGDSTLVSWGISISVVPEPVTWALGIFALLAMVVRLISVLSKQNRRVTFQGGDNNIVE